MLHTYKHFETHIYVEWRARFPKRSSKQLGLVVFIAFAPWKGGLFNSSNYCRPFGFLSPLLTQGCGFHSFPNRWLGVPDLYEGTEEAPKHKCFFALAKKNEGVYLTM